MISRYAAVFLLCALHQVKAEPICEDYDRFVDEGWQHAQVQTAMDKYMRDHRMRANWLNQPAPPDQIGRDYYEWLWHSEFGAVMKRELTGRFCGSGH